jgi:predicted dehydrogenase
LCAFCSAAEKIPFHTTDIAALAARPEIAIVFVTTPPSSHSKLTKVVLEAGKHVVLEKPFVVTAKEAVDLYETAVLIREQRLSQGLPVPLALMDHEWRALPHMNLARRLIADPTTGGRIMHANVIHLGAVAVKAQHTWWDERAHGGGILFAIGSHCVDIVSFVGDACATRASAALEISSPTKPDATGKVLPVTADDYANARIEYTRYGSGGGSVSAASGASFSCQMTLGKGSGKFSDKRIIFVCSGGTVEIDMAETVLKYFPATGAASDAALKMETSWEVEKGAAGVPGAPNAAAMQIGSMLYRGPRPAAGEWPSPRIPFAGFTFGSLLYFKDLFAAFSAASTSGGAVAMAPIAYAADFVDGVREQLILDACIASSDDRGKSVELRALATEALAASATKLPKDFDFFAQGCKRTV